MLRRILGIATLAALCTASCKDTSGNDDNLIPPGEPNVAAMTLTIGGSSLSVSKRGVVDGIVVIRPGTSDVHADFFGPNGLADPVVTPDAFRLEITANNDSSVVFVRSATDPFSGTLTVSRTTFDTSLHITLYHVPKNHIDWLTDFSQVLVRD